jgi:flavin-dependent dehydrogenase
MNLSYHLIPLGGPIPKTYHNGFLAVGDVASQVKPTTGGGIVMGLTCARIAGKTVAQAVQQNDFSERFLSEYQHQCQKATGFDMIMMKHFRSVLNHLSDSKIDRLIDLCSKWNVGEDLQKVRDIDFQGRAIIPLLKSPGILTVVFYSLLASIIP